MTSPFDEQRYKSLLEGLEVSEVWLSELRNENNTFRIDSEYFKKQFLNFFKNVPDLKPLEYYVKDGYRVVYENTQIIEEEEGRLNNCPYFLQATDLSTPFITKDNLYYVKEDDWMKYPKGRISKGEVLIEVKGKIEKVAIVPDDFPEKTLVSGSLFKLTINNNISKHVLLCYLISKYGVAFKDRYKTNLLISYISKPDLYRIPIPQFSKEFQKQIDEKFKMIFDASDQSQTLYRQAEELLLETIGLKDFQPTQENKIIKSFSESFLATGRLDAEYYQPKYEEIENKIKNMSHACLSELTTFINHGKQPPYIENGTVRVFSQKWIGDKSIDYSFLEAMDEPFTSAEFATQNSKYIARKNDILYYSVGANIGYCHNYLLDEPIMPGSFITLIRVNNTKINPIYLGVVLNSLVGRFQATKRKSASAQPYIYPKDISEFVIPLIENEVQQQIAELIKKSFYLCSEGKRLLKEAKDTVEKEIECQINQIR